MKLWNEIVTLEYCRALYSRTHIVLRSRAFYCIKNKSNSAPKCTLSVKQTTPTNQSKKSCPEGSELSDSGRNGCSVNLRQVPQAHITLLYVRLDRDLSQINCDRYLLHDLVCHGRHKFSLSSQCFFYWPNRPATTDGACAHLIFVQPENNVGTTVFGFIESFKHTIDHCVQWLPFSSNSNGGKKLFDVAFLA